MKSPLNNTIPEENRDYQMVKHIFKVEVTQLMQIPIL